MRIWLSDGDRRLKGATGYGQISASLARGLIEAGHDVQFQQFPGMEVVLFVCPPDRIKLGRRVSSAAITMHELDHLPEQKRDWVDVLNRLDLVITPTEWNREVWRREGVKTPIEVVPLGVDRELFFPITGRRCTFLTVHGNLGGTSSREDWRDTLRAYYSAFTKKDSVLLVIKTWKWKPQEFDTACSQLQAELHIDPGAAPEIEVIDDTLAAEDMRALYHRSWLFIKNANREGWSLPCSEAVACGTSVAATRIEPLISHLPERTIWFERGAIAELGRIMKREQVRFSSFLRRCQRSDAAITTSLIDIALTRLLAEGARRQSEAA